jgi:hypothetical protein
MICLFGTKTDVVDECLRGFVYLPEENAYRCPAGSSTISIHERGGRQAARVQPVKSVRFSRSAPTGPERRIPRWEHEHLLEVVQQRLDASRAVRVGRETVEHPFGTMKMRLGATHFLTKTLPKVAAEIALSSRVRNSVARGREPDMSRRPIRGRGRPGRINPEVLSQSG